MGVDWQRMDCPSCGEGLQCVLCGADVRRFDDAAVERAALAIAREAGHASTASYARRLAEAALRAAGGQDAS